MVLWRLALSKSTCGEVARWFPAKTYDLTRILRESGATMKDGSRMHICVMRGYPAQRVGVHRRASCVRRQARRLRGYVPLRSGTCSDQDERSSASGRALIAVQGAARATGATIFDSIRHVGYWGLTLPAPFFSPTVNDRALLWPRG